jgi:SAM-dependent methyltransferase
MCETLEHLNFNPLPLLGSIRRILAPGGIFYVAMPNQTSLRNRLRLALGKSIHNPISDYVAQLDPTKNMVAGLHWREYTLAETIEMLERTGFKPVKNYYFSESNNRRGLVYSFLPSSLKPSQVVVACKTG